MLRHGVSIVHCARRVAMGRRHRLGDAERVRFAVTGGSVDVATVAVAGAGVGGVEAAVKVSKMVTARASRSCTAKDTR